MKEKIHPTYYQTTATCACGAVHVIGSTKEKIHVDICSACHPLFTGKQKILDAEGRVQKFKKRYAASTSKASRKPKKKKVVKSAAARLIKKSGKTTTNRPKRKKKKPAAG